MKRTHALVIGMLVGLANLSGQPLQLARVTLNDSALHAVPRYSWLLPITKRFSLFEIGHGIAVSLNGGLLIRNQGIIYDRGTDRLKHRIITAGPIATLPIVLGNKWLVEVGYSFNYSLHYKEKRFVNRLRKNKQKEVSEWFSSRTPPFLHGFYGAVGMARGIRLFAEYFPGNLYNTAFQDPQGQHPYAGLKAEMFNVGIDIHWAPASLRHRDESSIYEEE